MKENTTANLVKKYTLNNPFLIDFLKRDLPKYPNKMGNRQFTTAQRLSAVILYFHSKLSLREFFDYFNTESS